MLLTATGPPLSPDADEARRLLEIELAKSRYQEHISVIDRVMRWLDAHLPSGREAGAPLWIGLAVVVTLALVGLGFAIWRLRDVRQVAAERRQRVGGLTDPGRSAQDYRTEAQRHLDEGAHDRAVVAAFRALVVELDERDVVHDAPGRTAHEVAQRAGHALPALAPEIAWAASTFDAACYGHPDGPLPAPGDPQRTTDADARRLLDLTRLPQAAR